MGITKDIRDVNVAYYYPTTVSPSKEFKTLASIENPEYKALWEKVWKWFCNSFVYDIDSDGAERWETMLSLPIRRTASLEDRKRAILSRLNHTLPYTERRFQEMLDVEFGEGLFTFTCTYNKYEFQLIASENAVQYHKKAYRFARVIIPANLLITSLIPSYQYYKMVHTADMHLSLETQQGYWVDSTFINLYWNGYHYTGGEGHTYNRTFKADNTVKYDGVLYKHTHYFNGELENSGKEWLEIGGNKQRHSADIYHLIEPKQVYGQVKGYKLNSHFKMNSTIKYEWPKTVNYLQTALCITTRGGISTQEAV